MCIRDSLNQQGLKVVETGIEIEHLLTADEIFLTDVIHGMRWVSAFRKKRYFNKYSKKLLEEIQDEIDIKKA